MPYRRFLIDRDYLSLMTDEHMKQVVRGKHDRLVQAEQRAEMNMLEYLDQYYEIERVLAVGKNIAEYNPAVTYPTNVYFQKDGEIYKTLSSINGYKKPDAKVYWEQLTDMADSERLEKAKKYSQLRTYSAGDIVKFCADYWQCVTPHGYESNEIHIPNCNPWQEMEYFAWKPNMLWDEGNVCFYGDKYYMYIGGDAPDPNKPEPTPDIDDRWGLIADYTLDYEYNHLEGAHDYVVHNGKVYVPVLNPNAAKLADGENIMKDDPRNINVVAHMSRIALYYLHQLISPTNISETRRWAFEDSMDWLYKASKFKINPQIPRKMEDNGVDKKVDWAIATFQKDFDPNENDWLI